MSKYNTFVNDNKVIVVTRYCGRRVKGIAKCSPEDSFSMEKGEALAKLRCDEKVASKRVKRATKKAAEALEDAKRARDHLARMLDYSRDSQEELKSIRSQLENFKKSL